MGSILSQEPPDRNPRKNVEDAGSREAVLSSQELLVVTSGQLVESRAALFAFVEPDRATKDLCGAPPGELGLRS